jgi:hypothetical protein
MRSFWKTELPGESLGSCLRVIFGVWFLVFVYAALHDQVLIRIHPEHFTVWHYQIPFTTDLTLLAILYAFGASISPGLALGVALFFAGRFFSPPKKSVGWLLRGTWLVFVLTELCAAAAGLVAWKLGRGIFPSDLYPDYSEGIAITQSVQITAYLSGAIFSAILLAWTWISRVRAMKLEARA